VRDLGRAHHASTEQLSALLDSRSEPDEQAFLTDHVGACVVCSSELADLRSVRAMLRAMPVYLPPRSFVIPVPAAVPVAAAAAPPVAVGVTSTLPWPLRFVPRTRLMAITRTLSAVAAVLCVVLFSADAMQTDFDAMVPLHDASPAMQITASRAPTSATARSVAETEAAAEPAARSSEGVRSQPASAAVSADGGAAKPAESSTIVTATASSRGEYPPSVAAAPPASAGGATAPAPAPPAQAAAARKPAAPQAAAPQPQATAPPLGTVVAFTATQAAAVPTGAADSRTTAAAPAADARAEAQAASGPPVGEQVKPATAGATTRGMTPLRTASFVFAVVAAILLVGSIKLGRADRERQIADAGRSA
jgi:hypothetical protein